MGRLFAKLFDIHKGELTRALLMFLYTYLILTAYLILKPVRNSLFLVNFGADQLPYMYMLIAIVATPVSTIYGRYSRRVSLPRLIGGSTAVIIICLALFWWLIKAQFDWLNYLFYVWVSLFGVFTTSQGWLLANYVFDAREAKRIFPFIASGAILGGITGSQLTSLLAEPLGTENMLWVCAGLMALCFGILAVIWPRRAGAEQKKGGRRPKEGASSIWPTVWQSRHLRLITAIISVTVMVSTIVDFQFNKVVANAFDDKDALTAFFGDFFFYLSLASLGLQLVFSSRIIRRFGIGAAILFLPVGLLLGSAAILVWPVLWSAVVVKISDGSFRYSINKSGFELLYLPLPAQIKGRVKSAMDVVGDRFARGISGGLLYLVNNVLALPVHLLSLLSGGLIAVWIVLSITIKREYSRTFRAALERRTLDESEIRVRMHDADSIAALTRTLRSPDINRVLFALRLSSQVPDRRLVLPLSDLLRHDRVEVRRQALEQLHEIGSADLTPGIEPLMQDDDPELRTLAVQFMCDRVKPDPTAFLTEILDGTDSRLQASAFQCVLQHHRSPAGQSLLTRKRIEHLLSGPHRETTILRREIASALGELPAEHECVALLSTFMTDSDHQVRRGALLSAARLGRREYLPVIIGYLGDYRFRSLARDALFEYGPTILPVLRDYVMDPLQTLNVRRRIPKAMSLIGTEQAMTLLFEMLDTEDFWIRHEVIKGLNRLRRREPDVPVDQARVEKLVIEEARAYFISRALQSALRNEPDRRDEHALLLRTLHEREKLHLELAFRFAGLIYLQDDMLNAYTAIATGSGPTRAGALEFLDTVWERSLKTYLLVLLDEGEQAVEAGLKLFRTPRMSDRDAIRYLLTGSDRWLAACAAYTAARRSLIEFRDPIAALTESRNPILGEAANAALQCLS